MAVDALSHGVDYSQWNPIFGKLSWDVLPLNELIVVVTFLVVAIVGLAVLAALTYYRLWGYLWKEWFTSIDHKKIGIMYMVLGVIMLVRALRTL